MERHVEAWLEGRVTISDSVPEDDWFLAIRGGCK